MAGDEQVVRERRCARTVLPTTPNETDPWGVG